MIRTAAGWKINKYGITLLAQDQQPSGQSAAHDEGSDGKSPIASIGWPRDGRNQDLYSGFFYRRHARIPKLSPENAKPWVSTRSMWETIRSFPERRRAWSAAKRNRRQFAPGEGQSVPRVLLPHARSVPSPDGGGLRHLASEDRHRGNADIGAGADHDWPKRSRPWTITAAAVSSSASAPEACPKRPRHSALHSKSAGASRANGFVR